MSSRNRNLMIAFGTLVSLALVVGLVARGTGAATDPKGLFVLNVRGTIYDPAFTQIEGADVTVESWDGTTLVQTIADTSNSTGFYSVTFAASEWDVGYTISVTADYSGDTVTNSTDIAAAVPILHVNVTLTTLIPEFSGLGLVVVCSAFVLIAAVAHKSRGR